MASKLRGLRINDTDWQAIQDAASERNLSASALILEAVKTYLENETTIAGAAPRGNPNIATLNKKK